MNKKVALYVRVSTREQAEEGYSIDQQLDRLRKYCEAREWTIVDEYVDAGFSGAKTDRPALQRMIKDIDKSLFEMVIVYKLDRLSRSQKDTLYLIEDVFKKNNVDFTSMMENLDTSSAFGMAIIGILSVFAQLERSMITERMAMGREARAKEGYFHGGGYDPIGYDYINGELVINEYEALQVRKIFDMFESGASIHEIKNYMHSKYTNKYGSWHSSASIYSTLETPIVAGIIRYNGIEVQGKHEPIISKERFDHAQELMKERRKNLTSAQKNPFKRTSLLAGLIFCGNCGARYYVKEQVSGRKKETRQLFRYYTCYSRGKSTKHMIIDENCKNITLREDRLNKLVIDEILKLQLQPDLIDEMANDNDVEREKKIIDQKIADLNKQIDKLMDLYTLGSIPIDKINEKITSIQEEISNLESAKMDLTAPVVSADEAKEKILNAKDVFTSGSFEDQVSLIRFLIDQIILFDDHIEIYWNFQ